jgi:hypothetical protein
MFAVRVVIGFLFISALWFTAAQGWCAEQNLDQQIAERTRQYQESLRQRALQLSPSLQAKIESQAQQTVAKGLEKWKKGEISIHIALPGRAESIRLARFVARHFPFPGSPSGAFGFGIGSFNAALTITTVQYFLKAWTIPVADSIIVHSSIYPFRQDCNSLSYFVRVVCTIVQRR